MRAAATTTTLQPMPPFINDVFVLNIILKLGGKTTLPEIKAHIMTNYSGWTKNHLIYATTQLHSLVRSGYLGIEKMDIRTRRSCPGYYVPDEVRAIIERSRQG